MKKYFVFIISISLFSFMPAIVTQAAPKENTRCTTIGKLSGKLTCVSLDGKKFWYELTLAKGVKRYAKVGTDCFRENMITTGYDLSNKLVKLNCKYPSSIQGSEPPKWINENSKVMPNSGSTNLMPVSKLSDSTTFSNLEPCKISDGDPALTNMTAGFPIPPGRIDLKSGANIQIIGVDFNDKKAGTKSPEQIHGDKTKAMKEFWVSQSTVPVKVNLNWFPSWVTMPNSIKSYQMGGSFFEGKFNPDIYFNFAKSIISLTDSQINFQGTNLLIIVFPSGVTSDEIGTFLVHTQGTYSTNEGSILNLIMAGGDYANTDTYIHEFGHALGLTDIRDTLDLANQKSDGMFYDTMNNPDYPELLVWHRYLLGFLEQNQLHCITNSQPSTHWINPVAKSSQALKGVVIPLSSTEAIIVESRRAIGYDTKLASRKDLIGAVVYSLDSKIPYRRTPVKVIKVLSSNQEVITNGFKISVIESGDFGDVVKIEKVS